MIYKYQRITTPGPNGTTIYCERSDGFIELCQIDGWWYVFVPDSLDIQIQPEGISWQVAILDDALIESIKSTSPMCVRITEEQQRRIRSVYPIEDEMYFARIGVGAALGAYQFRPGEQDALLAFGAYVEAVRQWGRDEREKIGL